MNNELSEQFVPNEITIQIIDGINGENFGVDYATLETALKKETKAKEINFHKTTTYESGYGIINVVNVVVEEPDYHNRVFDQSDIQNVVGEVIGSNGASMYGIQIQSLTIEKFMPGGNGTDSKDWGFNWSVVITGMLIVFAILILLIFIMKAFGSIMVAISSGENSKKDEIPEKPILPSESDEAPEGFSDEDASDETNLSKDAEIVAAITAAVYAFSDSETQPEILSITPATNSENNNLRKGRTGNAWKTAGILQNTKPF